MTFVRQPNAVTAGCRLLRACLSSAMPSSPACSLASPATSQAVETLETAVRLAVPVNFFAGCFSPFFYPQGTTSLAGGNPSSTKGVPHGSCHYSLADADLRRASRPAHRSPLQVPYLRREAAGNDTRFPCRSVALRRQGDRYERRGDFRPDRAHRLRGRGPQPRNRRARRGRKGSGQTLCPPAFRRRARGHAGNTHRISLGRNILPFAEDDFRQHPGKAADPGTPVPLSGRPHQATGRATRSGRLPSHHPHASGCGREGFHLG